MLNHNNRSDSEPLRQRDTAARPLKWEDVMNIFAGSIEIQMLCWSVVLGLVQLVVATSLATKDQGLAYNLSPRDAAPPPVSTLAARLQRAFGNFRETFV